MKLGVSILNMDFGNLEASIKKIEKTRIDDFHMDIMDGHFVDNISYGPEMVKTVRRITGIPLITHLMIENPEKFVGRFFEAGSQAVLVHVETLNDANRSILEMDNMGISFNPDVPLEDVAPYLDKVNRVLVMSVYAGFGGQDFIEESLQKIAALKEIRKSKGLDFEISVDGGINAESASRCLKAGVDEIVVGSYITRADDPAERIDTLLGLC
ncbi:MAG: ribulose-phosphate 3-epimerase [Elusimicrobia bacterium]|nr:ribulose-phosphate 3-epimerase [Elusimicrobiota bacterium]